MWYQVSSPVELCESGGIDFLMKWLWQSYSKENKLSTSVKVVKAHVAKKCSEVLMRWSWLKVDSLKCWCNSLDVDAMVLVVLDQEGRCSPNRVSYGHLIQVPSTSCSPCRICFCSASRTTEGEPAWSAGGRLPNLSSTEGTHTLCQHLFSCSWLLYLFLFHIDSVVSNQYLVNVYKNVWRLK